MTDKEYWQAIYEAAKARDRDNADIFTENPYKRASDADKLKADIDRLNTIVERLDEFEKCRKCPAWSGTDCVRNPYTEGCLDDKVNLKNEIKRLEKENEQLKAKLEKNPLAIKQKIMEEDDYELTEREQATLFLDRMESDVEILHDIVENLDELLGKGIDEYIKGIDGVEGIKDMWERSAVRDFAEKLWNKIKDNGIDYKIGLRALGEEIDELLKEYE